MICHCYLLEIDSFLLHGICAVLQVLMASHHGYAMWVVIVYQFINNAQSRTRTTDKKQLLCVSKKAMTYAGVGGDCEAARFFCQISVSDRFVRGTCWKPIYHRAFGWAKAPVCSNPIARNHMLNGHFGVNFSPTEIVPSISFQSIILCCFFAIQQDDNAPYRFFLKSSRVFSSTGNKTTNIRQVGGATKSW